jgi:hypothetical protein
MVSKPIENYRVDAVAMVFQGVLLRLSQVNDSLSTDVGPTTPEPEFPVIGVHILFNTNFNDHLSHGCSLLPHIIISACDHFSI